MEKWDEEVLLEKEAAAEPTNPIWWLFRLSVEEFEIERAND